MSFNEIKEKYGVRFHKRQRVRTHLGCGTIVGSDREYLKVNIQGIIHLVNPSRVKIIKKVKVLE